MEGDTKSQDEVALAVGALATVHYFPLEEGIGGQPLPVCLRHAVLNDMSHEVTVLVDPDAIVLADGWDAIMERKVLGGHVAAGINPRSDTADFAGVPEWNFMAFNTKFWADHIGTFQYWRVDIGHLFADAGATLGRTCYTWPLRYRPFVGKAASVCGDRESPAFAFHAFMSTRKVKDIIPINERAAMLDENQERAVIGGLL